MSTREQLLIELYRSLRDEQELALAARHAPLLRFDAREPFLPLAAGYTIFSQDGSSPSMERQIQLNPPGKPGATIAIEYAIWWDWDIHHLYELEHVWIYLDAQDQPVRVEASWHGEYHEMPLQLENGRAVLLSEPGKHAFAPSVDWFHKRTASLRRVETLDVGAHACVLINKMFSGRIRRQVFDQTLVRSFLTSQAFEPSWDFSKIFSFRAEWLVPWSSLEEWIPRRVNACLDRLEKMVKPEECHSLRLFSTGNTLESLQEAASAGAEGLLLPIHQVGKRLRLGPTPSAADIEDVYNFCLTEPITVIGEPFDMPAVDGLVRFLQAKGLGENQLMTFANRDCLARYQSLMPRGTSALQITAPTADALQAAEECGAQFVHLRWENLPNPEQLINAQWVERVHRSGLGILSWYVTRASEVELLQHMGVDILWQAA